MTLIKNGKSNLLYGTDPECEAVYSKDGKLYALPPYWFRESLQVPATDDIKHPVFIQTDMLKVHEDGANFEMAIRPSHNPMDLFDTIQEGVRLTTEQILSQFPEHCLPNLHFLPTVDWEVERWKDMPEKFFMSTRFGCDPDEDVTNLEVPAREIDAKYIPERYCGGHMHISGSKFIMEDPHMAVRCMMLTAGLAAVANSDVPDLEHRRTFLYGKPGKFRIQHYGIDNPFGPDYSVGIEYRTVSCRWAGNRDLATKVWNWAEIGIRNLLEGGLGQELYKEISEPAISAILSSNQAMAGDLLSFVESKL